MMPRRMAISPVRARLSVAWMVKEKRVMFTRTRPGRIVPQPRAFQARKRLGLASFASSGSRQDRERIDEVKGAALPRECGQVIEVPCAI